MIVVQANGDIHPNDVQLYGGASKLPIDSIYQLPDKGNLLYTRHQKGLSPTNMHAIVGKGYFRLESYNVNAPSSIFPHGSLPSEILLSGRIFGIWDETYSGRDDDDLTSKAMYHDLVAQSGEVSGTSDSVIFTRLIETDTITMRFRIDRTRNELSGTIAMRSLEMDYLYTQFEMEFSGVALEGHSTEINASIADGLAARQISRIRYTEHRGPRTTSLVRFHYEGTKIDIRLRK